MIHQSVVLSCPPERAFEIFTSHMDRWWPSARRHLSGASTIRIQESGRFWEENTAGEFVELGRVTLWDSPRKIVLDFYPGTGIEAPTEATITFTPVEKGTLVDVFHGPTELSKHLFESRAPAYTSSWSLVLQALQGHAS